MTIKIKKSSLMCSAEEFAAAVDERKAVMSEYAAHLKGVESDAANEALAPDDRRVAFPPPESHSMLVMRAADAGYEIVGPSLAEKKAALFAEVRRMESEALQAIIPPAKARHWAFREADIRKKYADEMNAALAEKRPIRIILGDEDDLFMREQADRKARVESAMRSAARLEYSIDNLTEETIGGWSADMSEAFK